MTRPRGRYAPSPTGEIHLGNASTALLAWLSIRSRGGSFVLRVEDLDRGRSRAALAQQGLDDLHWLGLDWDEGPDRGGPFGPYEQWPRRQRYDDAFKRLQGDGRLYPCFCTRRDIAAAASAPQEPGETRSYPGTCREIPAAESRARVAVEPRHAWRYRVEPSDAVAFDDLVHGPQSTDLHAPGDFVVYRADGVPAYQLAVVVDDAAMRIDEVVRGDDLLGSTPAQLMLYAALQLTPPVFGHVPLLHGADGARLSKRHQGITLRELRERGFSPQQIVGRFAKLVGIRADATPLDAADLIAGFDLRKLAGCPEGYRVDPRDWVR